MERLSGKVALITGATHGMGRAVADLFAAEGATVVATDVSPPDDPPSYGIGRLDVADEADWKEAVATIAETHGRLDALVNNAGIITYEGLEELDLDTWNPRRRGQPDRRLAGDA